MKKITIILSIFVCLLILNTKAFSQINPTDKVLYSNSTTNINVGARTFAEMKTFFNAGTTTATSVIGLLKGDGTNISAAIENTDYVTPNGNTATSTLANNVVTNANMTGVVTSIGNTTSIANNAITNAMVAGISGNKVTGTVANANLVSGGAINLNGTNVSLGGSVTFGLQEVSQINSATTIASSFTGGLTISGQLNVTPSSTSTATTLNVGVGISIQPINSTATTNVNIVNGIPGNPIIEFPILNTSTGAVVLSSDGLETFNGNPTFTVAANSQNYTIKIRKISATNWTAVLN